MLTAVAIGCTIIGILLIAASVLATHRGHPYTGMLILAAGTSFMTVASAMHDSTLPAAVHFAVTVYSLWNWWNGDGGNNRRRLRRRLRRFRGVRRTAPAEGAA